MTWCRHSILIHYCSYGYYFLDMSWWQALLQGWETIPGYYSTIKITRWHCNDNDVVTWSWFRYYGCNVSRWKEQGLPSSGKTSIQLCWKTVFESVLRFHHLWSKHAALQQLSVVHPTKMTRLLRVLWRADHGAQKYLVATRQLSHFKLTVS